MMTRALFHACVLLLCGPAASVVASPPSLAHSNHIFNAIHSSMRQWGSSLRHNGMSLFIATVPAETHFYHGNSHPEPVTGMEWLAFEPEHALFFARPSRFPPGKGPPGRRPPGEGPPGRGPPGGEPPGGGGQDRGEQHVFGHDPPAPMPAYGYLHTYAVRHDIRLLYLDGMSAAKSPVGTLDTQDYLLAPHSRHEGLHGEYGRAQEMCNRSVEHWGGAIDGILRMEAGFEVILCSFSKHLRPVRIASTVAKGGPGGLRLDYFNYYQSVTARYDGIGGGRVRIDYDDFVTAFTHENAHLFQSGSRPRLNATSPHVLSSLLAQVDGMARKKPSGSLDRIPSHDWQAVADMVVSRYSPRLRYMTSGHFTFQADLIDELDRILRPFLDYSARDADKEARRCESEFIPANWPLTQASQSIKDVCRHVCSTLLTLLDEGERGTLSNSLDQLHRLTDWLDWSDAKRCQGCKPSEICLVPIWPNGSVEDWLQPNCVNALDLPNHRGYWNDTWG